MSDNGNGVKWWEIWEKLGVSGSVKGLGDLEKIMMDGGMEKGDILNKLVSSVRNYCYNRGYRKDNYKSDSKLREENKELMRRLSELEKLVK